MRQNLPHHFYDVDFCLRLRERGLQVVWTPYANLTYRGAGLRQEAQTSGEAAWMEERWGEQLRARPVLQSQPRARSARFPL